MHQQRHQISLPDAIRRGAAMRPQAFGTFFTWDLKTEELRSCVLGALYEGLGTEHNEVEHSLLLDELFRVCGLKVPTGMLGARPSSVAKRYPELLTLVSCPDCRCKAALQSVMMHLNDVHRWTREHIAAWVQETVI